MSRIGKKSILIPEAVEVKIEGQNVTVKGPKGELKRDIRPEIKAEVKDGQIFVSIKTGPARRKVSTPGRGKNDNAYWGLTRALLSNMVEGVANGYEKKLEIEGVGYKALLEGNDLVLKVGFTNLVKINAPPGIKFSVQKNVISVSGFDKELVGQIASKIRKVKPPEPYKGKGIRYEGEVVRRKEGKKVASATA